MVNKMKAKRISYPTAFLFGLSVFMSANSAYAAPGTLATAPLFVTTAVEPNVFLTLDDSGSMNWEHMYATGTAGFVSSSGLPLVGDSYRYYWHPDWYTDSTVMPPATYSHSDAAETWDDDMWVMRNHNANKLYYNPNTTYTPWPGVDSSGNPLYTDATPAAVLRDPNSPSGTTTDLTQNFNFWDYDDTNGWLTGALYIPTYFTWEDDGDGVIEASDSHTMYEIRSTTTSYPSGRTYAEEMQNFANWFQYYRSREFSAKAAIGSVINNSDSTRMGLDVFNDGHQEDVTSMSTPANKRNLLDTFYNINSSGGTPARRSLQRVGDMFRGTSSTAPILNASSGGECQQNFNILMSDGFWNGTDPGLGNIDASNTADGGFDGDQTESNDGGNYEDDYDDTLADMAMLYYETDLRGDLADNVPATPGVDLAEHQHLVTYTISFGLTGTLDSTVDDPLDTDFEWPDAHAGNAERVDDMWHAAYNARGQYLSAQDPAELEESLGVAIADIAERTATASAAAVTTARLTTDSIIYLTEFNTNRWQGTVYAYAITDLEAGELSATWSSGDRLTSRDISSNPREIITYDTSADGIPFKWTDITTAMKDDLKTNSLGGTDNDAIAEARLDYHRGDRSNEGQGYQFRERASLLGDIVHSAPVYVSEPGLFWPDESPFPTGSNAYSEFKESLSDDDSTTGVDEARNGVIYVGANDGMMHAFEEDSGDELFAYIPSYLFSTDTSAGLHYLTEQDYIHRYYNDLSPTVSDVYVDTGNGNGLGWSTILVGGQRAGGRGYYALDITNPSALNESNAADMVMWEFSYLDDADLGYTFSRPQIGMANNGEWVAVFGNGYNSTGDGEAKLFIVKITGGVDGDWSDSGDYIEISTGTGDASNINGLGSPQLVDIDGNGTIDRAYAGDLFGNMWAFDLENGSSTSWDVDYSLFTTIGNRPITTRPSVAFHPDISNSDSPSNSPNLIVGFGSGQYLVDADKNSTYQNYFYGVWDSGTGNLSSSNLVEQTYLSGYTDTSGNPARVLTNNAVDYEVYKGWYLELPDSGERQITNSTIRSNIVFFNTSVPTTDACSTGGYGYRFTVDLATGGALDSSVVDYDGDGEIGNEGDLVGPGGDTVPSAAQLEGLPPEDNLTENYIINRTDLTRLQDAPERQTGRVSWQELLR